MTDTDSPHISVCIPTYKRPSMLSRCLAALKNQETRGFTYSVVVIDNDIDQSSKKIVLEWQEKYPVQISYDVEPEQNISCARNKAVTNSSGDLIAFIDDDEFPDSEWLQTLYSTLLSSKADGVLGPVISYFEIQPPEWVIKSQLLERMSFATGTVLKPEYMRTGNVLMDKRILEGEANPFDPRFGRTGGEDGDFFRRMTERSYRFVWCKEAPVYETITPERFTRKYFIKRAILRGVSEAELLKLSSDKRVLKSLFASSLYTFVLPFLLLTKHYLFMKYLVKDCDHIGKILALSGIKILKERDF
jgi:succinoglycan biosynthesis protein ExoM